MTHDTECQHDAGSIRVERDVAAFKSKMMRSPFDNEMNAHPRINQVSLHEFEGDERFIIRKGDRSYVEGDFNAAETCVMVKTLFAELSSAYSIPCPVHFVVAKDSGDQDVFYILTERVTASKFEDLGESEKIIASSAIRRVFETLMTYYEDKAASREYFLIDLPDPNQYVYGSLGGVSTVQWYLIDTDPFHSNSLNELWQLLDLLHDLLEDVESKFSIDLGAVRERCLVLKENLPEE